MKKVKITMPGIQLFTVCTTCDAFEAELVKNTLADHGIESHIGGETQGGFAGTFEIGILVKESDAEQAREFIQVHHPDLLK